jgi:hypothetical protein
MPWLWRGVRPDPLASTLPPPVVTRVIDQDPGQSDAHAAKAGDRVDALRPPSTPRGVVKQAWRSTLFDHRGQPGDPSAAVPDTDQTRAATQGWRRLE